VAKKRPELNVREKSILRYIEKQIMSVGYPPSLREIGKAVGLCSTATVYNYLQRLEDKGYIKKQDKKGRTLRILKGVDGVQKKTTSKDFYTRKEVMDVPVLKNITSKESISEQSNITDVFPIPVEFSNTSDNFLITVRGDSMVEAGILDGDSILVNKKAEVENGDIVVTLLDNEATIKTYYKEKDHIRLQPENGSMQPIIVDDCEILGKVCGVFRKM